MHVSAVWFPLNLQAIQVSRGEPYYVTGGATGIGSSIVAHFAAQGARVAFFDIQDEAALQLIEFG